MSAFTPLLWLCGAHSSVNELSQNGCKAQAWQLLTFQTEYQYRQLIHASQHHDHHYLMQQIVLVDQGQFGSADSGNFLTDPTNLLKDRHKQFVVLRVSQHHDHSYSVVQFILEGQEEIGSADFGKFLTDHTDLLKADYALSADGGQMFTDRGTLAIALRGAVAIEVELQTLNGDQHSGNLW